MIERQREATLSKKWKCLCDDCGVDIRKAGEYVMIAPDIWTDELGLGWDDNLCIGCLEKRLGRRKGV